ncbi:hypothetical protein [Pseudomonas sp. PD9R]|uniref:hypothetical protein n=1 Tax=Pseudomonas sp. PD9R TaxID=2853534 RepID=UPI001C4610D6|nr:hypothetical protein [Pseudomonas sp. PD9R]MBV6823145.1 hypothetical protein [Pseudomonas sp. PD9R]
MASSHTPNAAMKISAPALNTAIPSLANRYASKKIRITMIGNGDEPAGHQLACNTAVSYFEQTRRIEHAEYPTLVTQHKSRRIGGGAINDNAPAPDIDHCLSHLHDSTGIEKP